MKIAFNPSTVAALTSPPNNKDITFDLKGHNIFARGVKFYGTDTNTWRPVVDNLTSDSTTSSLSAKQGKVLKALIDGKSNSGHTHDDRYLKLTGGTMASNALITFADSGSWGTDKGPQGARGGLYWSGQSDYAKLYAEETAGDNLDLVIQFGDDNSNGLSIRNKSNIQTSYISASGVITTGIFKGNLDWSYITNKPSSYTPSAHTHAWNSLTHSSTTANQAILTNGSANGWKLYTLNISAWDNAANKAHSHSNKSVLDGITSTHVSNWNTAYTFVHTITGTDTDNVINKWDEIVNFLAGITEDNKLNTLLNSKLSVYELADKTNVGTIKNNGIYYSTTDASSSTLTNSPFNNGFTLINMTSFDGGDDLRRSRLAFNAYGEIKVSDDRDQLNTAETWYNVLTSKNSGISGSTIKLNGTSITVYSSGTADGRYVKKSGDTMTGALNFANGTWNLVGDDSYMGDCNVSGHFGIKAANTTYPGVAFFNKANAHLGSLTAYSGNIKYGAYSLQFLDNGNTSVGASTWTNPFSAYDKNAVKDGQAICVWGQSSYLSNLASDFGDMSLWLKRINAKAATLNMVLDGEYYANGTQRLAHVSEIPSSLKNPYALTISLNGTSQGPYDGSAAKSINITPGSIGAATSGHNHDGRYVYNYGGTQMDGASKNKNALGMSTTSGISGDWWHILQAAWNDEYRWNSQIAFPTQNRNGMYYRSGLNDNTKWGAWVKLLDTGNSYVTNGKGVINGTTITQVENATNATNSTNARKLVNWYSARPTSLNAQFGDGSLRIFYATSSTTEGKSPNDATVLHLAWDNNSGWDSQLAINSPSGRVYTRSQDRGTWQPWKTLAFTTDIPSSLKNPYSFNVFGVTYDGSAARTVTTSTFVSQVNEATATVTDGTMLITSYASNSGFADTNAVNVPYKRKAVHLWEYIKAKTDSLYAIKDHNHDSRYVRAFGTSNDNIDSDWGQSFKTFDPIPSGTPPEKNPNISLLSIGENFNRRKQLAFTYSDDNIYYRRHTEGGFSNWRRLAFANEIPTSLKNPNAIKFKDINGNVVTYDGSAAKDLTSGTYIAKLPYGFASFASGATWGNTTGTSFASWNDSTGGSIDFRRDNPSSGKMSIKVDGRVYVNEGHNPVLSAESDNRFWGMRTPDGGNDWIRTPNNGLIPCVSGGAGGGHSSLGTNSWYFSTAYIDKVYGSLKGNADTASSASKLTTARNIALGTDLRGSANFDGSGNITINAIINACSVSVGSTNGLPFKRIAHFETGNSWNDNALLLYISEGYISGRNGICRVEFRTSNISSSSTSITASAAVKWLVRNGYGLDSLYAGYYVTTGKAYIDIYLKTTRGYQGTVIRVLQDSRGGINSNVQLINSRYYSDTDHKEAYSSVEAASTALYNRAYTRIVSGSDVGTVNYANSTGSTTKLQTARKLWGQSFDGTKDISGSLSGTGSITPGSAAAFDIGSNSLDYRYGYFQWIGSKSNTNLRLAANNSDNQIVLHTNGNVGIGTNSPSYRLQIIGDQYTTGWSRANDGFYCEGAGVHFTHNGSVGEIAMTSNNELTWGSSTPTLYFNFRPVSRGKTVTDFVWRAGSSTSWAKHSLGALDLHGDVYWTNGDATMKIYGVDTCCGKENVAFQSTFDGKNPLTSDYVTSYRTRSAILLQPRGGNVGINVSHDPSYALTVGGDTYSSGYVRASSGFIKGSSSDAFVLLGGGGHKAESSLRVAYASSAGSATSATKVIVNQHTTNDINYPLVWSNQANTSNVTENQLYKSWADLYYNPKNKRLTVGGSVVSSSFVKSGGTSQQLLRADGGIASFNWSGQSGQPAWLWGGNDFNSYYVYNPSNFRVAYAASAGNADTLDGEHASSFVRAGAIESGDGDLNALDTYSFIKSVNSKVASHSPKSATGWYNIIQAVHRNGYADGPSYIGQIALGMTVNTDDMFFRGKRTDPWKTVIHSGNIGSQTVANAYHLRINSANSWSTWNWSGQSGQPSWLWGSNDGTNMYVWNPSNFNVNTAQYLRSLGNKNCQTGRTQAYGDVYTYNTRDGNTGSATTYSSVIGFGRGTGGTVEIAGGWLNTNLYWRSLRDCCEDWFSWRTILDESNYASVLNNTYLPLAGGTMKGNARIGHGSGSLYIGNSGNDGWLYVQDMASQAGEANWKIYANGFATFKNLTVNGPTVVNGSTTLNSVTTLNGLVTNNRGILPASYDVNKNNIACYVWGDAMSTGVTAITDALDPKYVSVHYSNDNGASWTNFNSGDVFNLYANNGRRAGAFYLGHYGSDDESLTQVQKNQLMVTFEIPNTMYSALCWASVDIGQGVQTVCTVEIIAKNGTIKNTFTKNLLGWNAVNYINFWGNNSSVVNIGQDTARFVRFKFKHDTSNTATRNAQIIKIRLFSFTKYNLYEGNFSSHMAYSGHLYTYDKGLNATFPNGIKVAYGPILSRTNKNYYGADGNGAVINTYSGGYYLQIGKDNNELILDTNSNKGNQNPALYIKDFVSANRLFKFNSGLAVPPVHFLSTYGILDTITIQNKKYVPYYVGTQGQATGISFILADNSTDLNQVIVIGKGQDGEVCFIKDAGNGVFRYYLQNTSLMLAGGQTVQNSGTFSTGFDDGKARFIIYSEKNNTWYEFYCG